MIDSKQCYCKKGTYATCCYPFLSGEKTPQTPEELMRSRFSAFATKNVDYIEKTMTGPALEGFNAESLKKDLQAIEYVDLEVLNSMKDPLLASKIKEEVADVFLNLFYLADTLGIDLFEVAMKKIDANIEKYPAHIHKGIAKKYGS